MDHNSVILAYFSIKMLTSPTQMVVTFRYYDYFGIEWGQSMFRTSMGMWQNLYFHALGDEHPFATYFGVNRRVLPGYT